jgi:dCTP deaminase
MDKKSTGFWCSETLTARVNDLVPKACGKTRVDRVAIELCLGHEVFITGQSTKRSVQPQEQISIPAGQMALLLTEERIKIPADAMGFISMKSGVKLHGLVNISGFHVDPGYDGHLVFSVFNSGPVSVPLTRGEPLFMLFVCSLDSATANLYDGARQGLTTITDEMVRGLQGTFPSPTALQKQIGIMQGNVTDEIARVETKIASIKWWAGIIGVILGVVLSGVGLAIWSAISSLMKK